MCLRHHFFHRHLFIFIPSILKSPVLCNFVLVMFWADVPFAQGLFLSSLLPNDCLPEIHENPWPADCLLCPSFFFVHPHCYVDGIWGGQREREKNMLSLPTSLRSPSLFYWDVAPISVEGKMKYVEKEKSSSVSSPLECPCDPCGPYTDAMETILNSNMLWLLPKCGSLRTERNSAVRQHGHEEGQQGSWACLPLLLPSPGASANILPSQKVTQKL